MNLTISDLLELSPTHNVLYKSKRISIPKEVREDIVNKLMDSIDEENWYVWAQCKDHDINFFFNPDLNPKSPVRTVAATLCESCPVRSFCADAVVKDPNAFAFSVMAGTPIPYHPKRHRKTLRLLNEVAQDQKIMRNVLSWHVTLIAAALDITGDDPVLAWDMISPWTNKAVFYRVCSYLSVHVPALEVAMIRGNRSEDTFLTEDRREIESRSRKD